VILSRYYGFKVFENMVLKRIFGLKRDEMVGVWRKLYNAELHYLYSSQNIIKMIKSKRIRCTGHVECTGEKKNSCRIWWENQKERDY
jgi:hypothetical protein